MTLRTKLGYGVGDLGGNLFFTVVSFHLLIFFTDTVGLSPALTGLAFTVARLWDALTDPLMGMISGRREEGVYYGLWTLLQKAGQALAPLLVGVTLSVTGYVADVEQTTAALTGIRLLVGPFPAVFFAIAVAVLTAYPITRAAHANLQERLRSARSAPSR